jgi:hypothetical protein
MNRILSYIITVIVSVTFTLVGDMTVRASRTSARVVDNATNAAFRDGRYQAQLDAENGRKPHLSSGRWSTDQDRASYIAGYQQGYWQSLSGKQEKIGAPAPSELDGYRDGVSDGTTDRKSPLHFQLGKTEHYRNASLGLAASDPAQRLYWQNYQQAYSNGYQEAFYSARSHSGLRALSAPGNIF